MSVKLGSFCRAASNRRTSNLSAINRNRQVAWEQEHWKSPIWLWRNLRSPDLLLINLTIQVAEGQPGPPQTQTCLFINQFNIAKCMVYVYDVPWAVAVGNSPIGLKGRFRFLGRVAAITNFNRLSSRPRSHPLSKPLITRCQKPQTLALEPQYPIDGKLGLSFAINELFIDHVIG